MSREVTHEATGPVILDEDDIDEKYGNIAVCRCGLSDEKPFCDGSHKATDDEEDGVRYKYEDDDAENPRHVIDEIVFDE